MYSFLYLEPIRCSAVQVSRETGKMVWYCHLSKSFPQFVVIHTVIGFSVVNETEIGVFLNFPCFFYNTVNVGNLISSSSSFSKPSLDTWKFLVHITLKSSIEDFKHDLTSMGDEYNCLTVGTFLVLPFLGIRMRIDFFQSCGHCRVLQICQHNECKTLMASPFRDLNSSK